MFVVLPNFSRLLDKPLLDEDHQTLVTKFQELRNGKMLMHFWTINHPRYGFKNHKAKSPLSGRY